MQKETGFAEVNGTRLYYEVAGEGHPLVLIHGLVSDCRTWEDQFEPFAERFRVVCYEWRGMGRSAVPTKESYRHADDLRALLEYWGMTRTHVLGFSAGASIALDFALAWPEMTSALILVGGGAPPGYAWGPEWDEWFGLYRSTAVESGPEAANRLFLEIPLLAPAMKIPEVARRTTEMVMDNSGWNWLNDDPAQDAAVLAPAQFEAPVLIIVGEREHRDNLRATDVLSQQLPHAHRVVVPNVGHMVNMEAPEQFNELVLSFLVGVAPSN